MSFANRYGVNKALAEDGKWITKGGGLDVLVRRLNSKAARAVVTRENAKHSHLTRGGRTLPTDIAELVNRRVAAFGLLLDWRDTPKGEDNPEGLKGAPRPVGENGEEDASAPPIVYTPEVGIEYFIQYPDFLEEIIEDSTNIENYRDEERTETEGNS